MQPLYLFQLAKTRALILERFPDSCALAELDLQRLYGRELSGVSLVIATETLPKVRLNADATPRLLLDFPGESSYSPGLLVFVDGAP